MKGRQGLKGEGERSGLRQTLLVDTGNLVHPAIVSLDFWKSIGVKINSTINRQVGTADGQSEGLQVVGVGEPWPFYLEVLTGYQWLIGSV